MYIFALYILYSSKVLTPRIYYIRVVIMEQQTAADKFHAQVGHAKTGL
jgi:hypothetical protein